MVDSFGVGNSCWKEIKILGPCQIEDDSKDILKTEIINAGRNLTSGRQQEMVCNCCIPKQEEKFH